MAATKTKPKGSKKSSAKGSANGKGSGKSKAGLKSGSKGKGGSRARASSKPSKVAEAPEWMEECAAYAKPAPEHALLGPFVGKWKSLVRMYMEPEGDPQQSTGVMKNKLVLGGKFLEQVYEDDSGMFSGRGFWGYNSVDHRWEGFWIDSMSSFFQIEHGVHDAGARRWDNAATMTDPMSGRPMTKRSVIRVTGPDSHVMEMYFTSSAGPDAGTERKCMEIEYTRIK